MSLTNRYRIVNDYCGYTVQIKYWWFPIWWFMIGGRMFPNTNCSGTLKGAKNLLNDHREGKQLRNTGCTTCCRVVWEQKKDES